MGAVPGSVPLSCRKPRDSCEVPALRCAAIEVVGVGQHDGVDRVRPDEHILNKLAVLELLLLGRVGSHSRLAVGTEFHGIDESAVLVIEHEQEMLDLSVHQAAPPNHYPARTVDD